MIIVNGKTATHYCNLCGALWASLPPDKVFPDGGWTLVSHFCGPCCDNARMGEQIQPIFVDAEDLA